MSRTERDYCQIFVSWSCLVASVMFCPKEVFMVGVYESWESRLCFSFPPVPVWCSIRFLRIWGERRLREQLLPGPPPAQELLLVCRCPQPEGEESVLPSCQKIALVPCFPTVLCLSGEPAADTAWLVNTEWDPKPTEVPRSCVCIRTVNISLSKPFLYRAFKSYKKRVERKAVFWYFWVGVFWTRFWSKAHCGRGGLFSVLFGPEP